MGVALCVLPASGFKLPEYQTEPSAPVPVETFAPSAKTSSLPGVFGRTMTGRSHVVEWHHRCAMVSRWTRGAASGLRVDDLVAITRRTARFETHRRQRVTGSRRRQRRDSAAARFSSSPEASHESAHPASCSVDLRMGPLWRGRRATDPDRLSRRRRLLGLSQPRSIVPDTGDQQRRMRDLPPLGPCGTTAPVTVHRFPFRRSAHP